ncbi:MAG TPA: nucleoside phosphorylase [Bacteroidales bacterium]|jgi:uridine phosphorylase|nr:nucleoside phosphorylase [Bacteroidales bacterium]OQC58738.1 MAG: Uridine phosphorylase [Bacteroidetes bacterium ADurb.Bin013]MBP9000094.1 nucleoside phosphorylase [Bacteroidales bacterium]MBV6455798.1 Uridine phosphorylase [Bacteroidales bacterium]MCZ2316084.1 nucleoside phosphorylase [Bacteroidales bacterium]
MKYIEPSELVINSDGSVFHLHMHPDQLADNVLLVGDPDRVKLLRGMLTQIESDTRSREFVSVTGTYKNKRITLLSTGIGTDNIDIVMNELDALANVDFKTRTIKKEHRTLKILRLGTSGAIQPDIPTGSLVYSAYSAGIDGLLNWYQGRDKVCDLEMEKAFMEHMNWSPTLATPYFVQNSRVIGNSYSNAFSGITLSAPGFYGPQGRVIRLALSDPGYLSKLASFRYNGLRIMNFEMEGSAIAGLSRLLGHEGATVCMIIAQRSNKIMNVDYKEMMYEKAGEALDRLAMEEAAIERL